MCGSARGGWPHLATRDTCKQHTGPSHAAWLFSAILRVRSLMRCTYECRTQVCTWYTYIYFYHRTLRGLQNDELPTHTGGRYKISDIREIYGAGTRTSACSSGGCSLGGGPQSALFWRRVRRALAPRKFAGNPRRSLFGGWALPERNVLGGWHR